MLIDQLVHMHRSGFSSAVLAEGVDAAAAERQFARFGAFTRAMCTSPAPVCLGGRMNQAAALDLAQVNAELGRDASALVAWALGLGRPSIVTTNFRPFEAVILHLVTRAA